MIAVIFVVAVVDVLLTTVVGIGLATTPELIGTFRLECLHDPRRFEHRGVRPETRDIRMYGYLFGDREVRESRSAAAESFPLRAGPLRKGRGGPGASAFVRRGGGLGERGASDALGRIFTTLEASHRRVMEEQAALEESRRVLVDHVESIAHDLGAPLTAVMIDLHALGRSDESGVVGDLARRALGDLHDLHALTGNLRVAADLKGEGPSWDGTEPVELVVLFERAVRRAELVGAVRDVEVAGSWPDDAVPVCCSPVAAEQVFTNLIHNAVIHNRAGGHVAAVLWVDDGSRFHVRVEDDGPGVTREELERLSTELEDPSGSTEKLRAGLGLRIVAEVCRRAGWSLRLSPNEPMGLRVEVVGELAS